MAAVNIDFPVAPNRGDIVDMPYQHSRIDLPCVPIFVGPVFEQEHFVWILGIGDAIGDVVVNFVQLHLSLDIEFCGACHPADGHPFESGVEGRSATLYVFRIRWAVVPAMCHDRPGLRCLLSIVPVNIV